MANVEQAAAMGVIWNMRAGFYRPAFGRFLCGVCGHNWISWKSWRKTGQLCGNCHNHINFTFTKPYEVKAILYYFCQPCNSLWKDTNAEPRYCEVCGVVTPASGINVPAGYEMPVIPDVDEDAEGAEETEDTREPHKMELCEKCIFINQGIPLIEWVQCYEPQPPQNANVPAAAALH